jgi:hypothetical protein
MTDAADRTAPQCQECHCQTGGGEFCFQHKPYMVYPKADGSFLSDRNGRKHLWLDDELTTGAEQAEKHALFDLLRVFEPGLSSAIPTASDTLGKVRELQAELRQVREDRDAAVEELDMKTATMRELRQREIERAKAAEASQAALVALVAQWRALAVARYSTMSPYPQGQGDAFAACADELADALRSGIAAPQGETQEKDKNTTRVDGFPEGAHGDLPRRLTR